MTPQEAIDYLLDPIGKREQHDEAVRMAIEALMLQVPKKKINAGGWNVCPTCGHWPIQSYCNGCGQRIDWMDGE